MQAQILALVALVQLFHLAKCNIFSEVIYNPLPDYFAKIELGNRKTVYVDGLGNAMMIRGKSQVKLDAVSDFTGVKIKDPKLFFTFDYYSADRKDVQYYNITKGDPAKKYFLRDKTISSKITCNGKEDVYLKFSKIDKLPIAYCRGNEIYLLNEQNSNKQMASRGLVEIHNESSGSCIGPETTVAISQNAGNTKMSVSHQCEFPEDSTIKELLHFEVNESIPEKNFAVEYEDGNDYFKIDCIKDLCQFVETNSECSLIDKRVCDAKILTLKLEKDHKDPKLDQNGRDESQAHSNENQSSNQPTADTIGDQRSPNHVRYHLTTDY